MSLDAAIRVGVGDLDLDVALSVEPGEVLVILGPNGSGKTTTLRALAGLVALDAGHIALDATTLDDPDRDVFVPPEQRSIGVVFQQYLLFAHLDAIDNVAFGLRARGMATAEARRRAEAMLDRVGLADRGRARPAELSGGQAQRVALARALAVEPRLLLLDEPLAALDVGTRRDVRRDLRRHLDGFDGVGVLVTHDPVDAYALADRVAVIDHGALVQTGTLAEITTNPRSAFVADLIGTNLVAGTLSGGVLHTSSGASLSVVADFSGPAFALIRPRSVILSTTAADTSARNTFAGPVDEIERLGERIRVTVGGALALTAEITPGALDALGIVPGDVVYAAVKATDIETYAA